MKNEYQLLQADSTLPSHPVFVHISDIEGEFIPRKGDKVRYHLCPMPPKFDKFQAVHLEIVDFTPEKHHKWSEKGIKYTKRDLPWQKSNSVLGFSFLQLFNMKQRWQIPNHKIVGDARGVWGGPEGGGRGEGDASRWPDRERDKHGYLRVCTSAKGIGMGGVKLAMTFSRDL